MPFAPPDYDRDRRIRIFEERERERRFKERDEALAKTLAAEKAREARAKSNKSFLGKLFGF